MGHAHTAAMGMGAGMMVVAASAASLASCINAELDAARERRHHAAYGDALARASAHAAQMEQMARLAIEHVAQLDAQVKALTAACAQRQGCIDRLKARLS